MRALTGLFLALTVSAYGGCSLFKPAPAPINPTTVQTVPYFPDSTLTDDVRCAHAPRPSGKTVDDLGMALINERAHLDVCRGDRAAVRQWEGDVKAGHDAPAQ